jgi:trans-2,3-dihydro-3-hydroxyanthranilate isomerase
MSAVFERKSGMNSARRSFLRTFGAASIAAAGVRPVFVAGPQSVPGTQLRRFPLVQIDVFTSKRLQGNPLSVFTDARGLSDSEMQDLARETNLQETTLIFPGDPEIEREQGVKVRIFAPDGELPFAGHPTLGTASVLRGLRPNNNRDDQHHAQLLPEITLSLKVGKVPVSFREDAERVFGEMRQPEPMFLDVHDRKAVAAALGLKPDQIEADLPLQTVSTGLPFVIVPLTHLSTLQSLRVDLEKVYNYLKWQGPIRRDFYYVTRDTGDPKVGLRARSIYPTGEDPATGSAAGCTSAWMVKYGIARPEEMVLIRQGVEMNRPSDIFVRASKTCESVTNVRVGGHTVQIMEGEVSL